jgi:5-methylcytosine-specific restriction protein B
MDSVAPDVSNTSWGHKYFHLLYPEKLDDYHNPDYQRFHLIKLLYLPPVGKGRYYLAGYFVDIARQLAIPITSLGYILPLKTRVTRVKSKRPGSYGTDFSRS